MNPASEDRLLGEYRLKELVAENDVSRTWLAEQISVSRRVLVDELRADRPECREAFLADIRAKAGVDHPLVGSVYEAVDAADVCFFAHELLPGETLAEQVQAGKTLLPARLAHVLRRIAEAQLQHESLGQATSAMDVDAVHIDSHGVIRLKNLVIAGARDPVQSQGDAVRLGNSMVALIAAGKPGATRIQTVLSWMRGEGIDEPISWSQVRDFCMQVEHQLADPLSSLSPTQIDMFGRKKAPIGMIAGITAAGLLGIFILAFKMRPPTPTAPPRAELPAPVDIPAGKYPTPDGVEESFPAFRLASHETTIDEYDAFLQTLAVLAKSNGEHTFDHPKQPEKKISHEPDGWPALLALAKANGVIDGKPVTLDSPVVGIDWWDAAAYAEWKKGRLPTQEEWFAALNFEVKAAAAIVPGTWAPVANTSTDLTPAGLLGMAGSLAEWTAELESNPANPLGERHWVIIGGSYLKPGSNALTREWIDDRQLRRQDLGFRVLFEVK